MNFVATTSTIVRYTVFALFITVVTILLAARFAIPGGFRLYSVLSGSMEPAIPVGALVITSTPNSASDITEGDVITFSQAGSEQTITHRVASINEEDGRVRFTTKGDANERSDIRPVSLQDIQGVYKLHIPALGRMLEYLKTPLGVSIFILAPLLFLIADELRKGFRNMAAAPQLQPATVPAPHIKSLETTIPLVDSIVHQKKLPKTQRQYKVKVTALGVYIGLLVGLTSVSATHALFTSNTVSLNGNTLTTAAIFTTPTPTPQPSPSPSPNPSTEPDACDDADISVNTSNENTGPNSTNQNSVDISHECNIEETTTTETSTTVAVDAHTGNNTQNNNTAGSNQTSGDVTVTIGIQNSN